MSATSAQRRVRLRRRLLRAQQRRAWPVVGVPAIGVVLATSLASGSLDRVAVVLFAAMYSASMIGVCVGYHRMLAHRAFVAGPLLRGTLVAAGAIAGQGPPIFWVATHRRHHQSSDEAGDPHSPRRARAPERATRLGLGLARLRGLWHAHCGWMFTEPPTDPFRYAPDLLRDPVVAWVNRWYVALLVAGIVAPAVVTAGIAGSAAGAVSGLLWGGLVRVFATQHVTWSVNSICHAFGRKRFETKDESRNAAWLAIPTFGESWHNNHHAFPSSAAHGLRWYEIDLSWLLIRALATARLVRNVKRPGERTLHGRAG